MCTHILQGRSISKTFYVFILGGWERLERIEGVKEAFLLCGWRLPICWSKAEQKQAPVSAFRRGVTSSARTSSARTSSAVSVQVVLAQRVSIPAYMEHGAVCAKPGRSGPSSSQHIHVWTCGALRKCLDHSSRSRERNECSSVIFEQ